MDPSTLTYSLSILVPYLQAGKQFVTEHLDMGLEAVLPVVAENLFAAVKSFFSKEKDAKKKLAKIESKPDEKRVQVLKDLLIVALKDKNFREQLEGIFDKLQKESGMSMNDVARSVDHYAKKVAKNYSISNVKLGGGSTLIQGDGNIIKKD